MGHPISKSDLSEPKRRLIELLGALQFGTIEGLQIRGGEPLLTPAPRVIQKLRLGTDSTSNPGLNLQDFWLKKPVIDLLNAITDMDNGQIACIDVRHGLPFLLEIEGLPPGVEV